MQNQMNEHIEDANVNTCYFFFQFQEIQADVLRDYFPNPKPTFSPLPKALQSNKMEKALYQIQIKSLISLSKLPNRTFVPQWKFDAYNLLKN